MKSPWIEALRSVALTVPDLAAAEAFYTTTWQLQLAARADGAVYLRGSGSDHHLLALHAAPGTPMIRQLTLRARTADAFEAIARATVTAGGVIEQAVAAVAAADGPAGGLSLLIRDADGRRIEVVHGDARRVPDEPTPRDPPVRLAHAVLNSHAIAGKQAFFERALGFASFVVTQSPRAGAVAFDQRGSGPGRLGWTP